MKKDLLKEAARLLENTSLHSSAHVEEFTVPFDLMGLAIGSHGANIQSARNIEGVEDIQLVESNDGHTPVLFKVNSTFYNLPHAKGAFTWRRTSNAWSGDSAWIPFVGFCIVLIYLVSTLLPRELEIVGQSG